MVGFLITILPYGGIWAFTKTAWGFAIPYYLNTRTGSLNNNAAEATTNFNISGAESDQQCLHPPYLTRAASTEIVKPNSMIY